MVIFEWNDIYKTLAFSNIVVGYSWVKTSYDGVFTL